MSTKLSDPEIAKAQKLRLRWVFGGSVTYCSVLVIAWGCYGLEMLNLMPALFFTAAVLLINLMFVGLIKSDLNLRFKDPSLMGFQVFMPLWPSIYVMYHITDPQARMAFLLMAVITILFGVMVFNFKRMLAFSAVVLLAYLMLVAALMIWAGDRLNLRAELIIVFAYAAALVQVAFMGSYIQGLRRTLRKRNKALKSAMSELQDLAMRDPLTRLPNRRSVMEHLTKEQARAERRHPDTDQLCICMLDIDWFKRVNDDYGHQVGDAVLKRVGWMLQKLLRRGDFAGRYGGEEFMLILPESSAKGAYVAGERIRLAIADMPIPEIPDGKKITVSIGLAVHQSGDSVEHTIRQADEALYEAKNLGRDQVFMAPHTGQVKPLTETPT